MAACLRCLKPDVIVLGGDAGFHSGLLGEYTPDGSHGGKRRYRFTGPAYKGRSDIFLMWSAVENLWVVKAPRDRKRNLPASLAWISCRPIIRNGPGTGGPEQVPPGNWELFDTNQRASADKLIVIKARPGTVSQSGAEGLTAADVHSPTRKMRNVDYRTARRLCRYFGWMGLHQFYMGRPYHGFAMMQSLGFFGLGWAADELMFDSLYVKPPAPPADKASADYKRWEEVYGEPSPPPTVLNLPLNLRLEFHDMDVARAVMQLVFAWVYEYAFRIFFQYSQDTFMLVWALKILGCCIAVWLVGSIGGVRASIGAMAQAIAVVVGACAMLFRFPIWAPQFSFFVRVGIIVVYYFTRRPRPKHLGEGFVFIAPSHAQFESKNDRRRDESAKAKKDHHGKPPSGRVVASSTSGSWKTTVVTASVAQAGFLILAGVSFMNNTIITCSYREHLSLRELIFIAVKEHGLNIPKVVSLTRNLVTAWREDCWDGLYNYLDKPSEGDVLYAQFTRPFEVLGLSPTATFREVKSAYRKLALKHHPDKNTEDFSDDVFVQIQEAYAQLKKRFNSQGSSSSDGSAAD